LFELLFLGAPGFEYDHVSSVWESQIYPIVKNVVLSRD